MPEEPHAEQYEVTATDMHGGVREGAEAGESAEGVVSRLREAGWQVNRLAGRRARRLFEPRRIDLEEFAFFNAELASAVKSGLPLPGALRALSRDMSGRAAREAVERVAAEVEGGADLAEALARQGDAFPAAYVALVAAGLEAGDLAGTLLLFEGEARFAARLRHRFAAALAYPLLVMLVGSFLLAFLSRDILPTIASLYYGHESYLPGPTSLVLALGPVLRWAPVIVLGLIVLGALAWQVVSRGAAGSWTLGRVMLGFPLTGRFFRAVAMARFCRTLATALRGRMPVPEAVTLAGLATGNGAVQHAADLLRAKIEEGAPVADALAADRLFPSTVVWMVHIGEQRGDVVPALIECARLEESRARRAGEMLPLFAAGTVTAFGAILLGLMAFAVLLPLFRFGAVL
ncbi:MAG: type II secretion system F family protein [Planctomycetota bacterium]|jgi:type II secretory pathway component PulF